MEGTPGSALRRAGDSSQEPKPHAAEPAKYVKSHRRQQRDGHQADNCKYDQRFPATRPDRVAQPVSGAGVNGREPDSYLEHHERGEDDRRDETDEDQSAPVSDILGHVVRGSSGRVIRVCCHRLFGSLTGCRDTRKGHKSGISEHWNEHETQCFHWWAYVPSVVEIRC